MTMERETVICDRCGDACTPTDFSAGYGLMKDGARHCFKCCGETDRAEMIETGRATLYYVTRDGNRFVTNWPGTLSLPVDYAWTGRHNIAGVRYDFRFTGPDGAPWHGTQYGNNTQIAHCRRVRR